MIKALKISSHFNEIGMKYIEQNLRIIDNPFTRDVGIIMTKKSDFQFQNSEFCPRPKFQ